MSTLTMQAVADLAQVRRPVVSAWRSRFAASDRPFPAPVQDSPTVFDAGEVGRWLDETGHGNNPEAGLEAVLHSSAFDLVDAELDRASSLLLLHQLRGEGVTGLEPGDVEVHMGSRDVAPVLDPATVRRALDDAVLCDAVDQVAEAAYSAAGVLDRLVSGFTAHRRPWADLALTGPGSAELSAVLGELARGVPTTVVPSDSGGLLLASSLISVLNESEPVAFGVRPELLERACDRTAWRRLVARDHTVAPLPESVATPALHLLMSQAIDNTFFDSVEHRLLDLGKADLLVVVGPAELMTDEAGAAGRRHLLTPTPRHVAPLRYVARLPAGWCRHHGRRRLALWVFGRPASTWTVVGAHSGTADGSAIAADVTAAVSDDVDVAAHAFASSAVVSSAVLLGRPTLIAPPTLRPPRDGGERLARIWELDPDLATAAGLAAASPAPQRLRFSEATRRLARDATGVRIATEHLTPLRPASAAVIGPEEIRDPRLMETRGIDRSVLEDVAPRSRLTEPGDVIYVSAGGPAALVDREGGHIVLSPARVLRFLDAESDDRQLVPEVVAADIAAQPSTDRRTWLLRTVPAGRAAALADLMRRTAARRAALLAQLDELSSLEHEIVDGFADATLTSVIPTTTTATRDE